MSNLKKVYSSISRAHNFLNKTICNLNPNIVLEIFDKKDPKLFGVKNTSNISKDFIKKLCGLEYFWHTIDKASDRGRAVDIELKNPITGKNMTGSSSGTAINVLYGLNDIGIGTDGGGSILCPAIALNLYSVLYKGIGFVGTDVKKSTDNIEFTPGIGIISQYYSDIEKISFNLLEEEKLCQNKKVKILVLNDVPAEMEEILSSNKIEYDNKKINIPDEREHLISLSKEIMNEYDIVLYMENLIDVDGFGDSVFGTMGITSKKIQNNANKKFVKILNMIKASAITLPCSEISSALVIFCGEGEENFIEVLKLGKILDKERRTQLFKKYFLEYSLQEIDNRWFK